MRVEKEMHGKNVSYLQDTILNEDQLLKECKALEEKKQARIAAWQESTKKLKGTSKKVCLHDCCKSVHMNTQAMAASLASLPQASSTASSLTPSILNWAKQIQPMEAKSKTFYERPSSGEQSHPINKKLERANPKSKDGAAGMHRRTASTPNSHETEQSKNSKEIAQKEGCTKKPRTLRQMQQLQARKTQIRKELDHTHLAARTLDMRHTELLKEQEQLTEALAQEQQLQRAEMERLVDEQQHTDDLMLFSYVDGDRREQSFIIPLDLVAKTDKDVDVVQVMRATGTFGFHESPKLEYVTEEKWETCLHAILDLIHEEQRVFQVRNGDISFLVSRIKLRFTYYQRA